MIRYALTCPSDHEFDSWFQSASAFDGLLAAGHITCPICGSAEVAKSLMAPGVATSRGTTLPDLAKPQNEVEAAFAAMRKEIEANSDYVGVNFVAEARKMHHGEVPERSIYGEARPEEARALLEEGVPVAPLPFLPPRKAN
jgi:hypothetical protein